MQFDLQNAIQSWKAALQTCWSCLYQPRGKTRDCCARVIPNYEREAQLDYTSRIPDPSHPESACNGARRQNPDEKPP